MKPDNRPMSPYMIGPYYKPQLTSMLSILSRLTGVFLTVVSVPLVLWWLWALASGPESFAVVQAFGSSVFGSALWLASTFSISYHLINGIRHLIWDTAGMLEMEQIYLSGYIAVILAVVLTAFVWWGAS